ncbi:MgtC/SapB family protein [Streptomyces lunalinharesii]
MSNWIFAANLGVALLLGAAIGLERQWRARGAGLRTTALVAAGAALFVMLSKYGFADLADIPHQTYDGSRVAAQIVSGIGFLGAGVIMRSGERVHGLNTAATMWCAAAVGALCGAQMQPVAAIGTAGIVFVHTVLRPLARWVDRTSSGGEEADAVPCRYAIRLRCTTDALPQVRTRLVRELHGESFSLVAVRGGPVDASTDRAVNAVVSAPDRWEPRVEQVVGRLAREAGVREAAWRAAGPDEPRRARSRVRSALTAWRSRGAARSGWFRRGVGAPSGREEER